MAQEVSHSLLPVPIPEVWPPLPEQLLKPDYEGRNTAPVPVEVLPQDPLSLTAFRIFFWSRFWEFLYLALESVVPFKIFS